MLRSTRRLPAHVPAAAPAGSATTTRCAPAPPPGRNAVPRLASRNIEAGAAPHPPPSPCPVHPFTPCSCPLDRGTWYHRLGSGESALGDAHTAAVRYVVMHRARDHRCRAERGVLRVPWPMACMATGASLTLDVGWSARVILAGRDKRTRLRFSRISIARCADLVRSSASARGPLSGSVHPVREVRATDQRPCAQDLRPGVGSTAEFLRREIGESDWQAWWCRLLTQREVAGSRRRLLPGPNPSLGMQLKTSNIFLEIMVNLFAWRAGAS